MSGFGDKEVSHGVALYKLAEHEQFTSVNRFPIGGDEDPNAYQVNANRGLYLKRASKEAGPGYLFTFNSEHRNRLEKMTDLCGKVNLYIGLVCLEKGEICCASYDEFLELKSDRMQSGMTNTDDLPLYVSRDPGESFRLKVQHQNRNEVIKQITISMNKYPKRLL